MRPAFYCRPLLTGLVVVFAAGNAAVAVQPNHSVQQEILRAAHLWQSKYRTDLARQHIEKLLLLEPDSPWGLATLASIALQENKPHEAKQVINKLYAQDITPELKAQVQHLLKLYEPQAQQDLAQMRLFAQSGRTQDAAALAHKLFPHGPLALGGFALEYYRTIAAVPGADPALEKKLLSEYERTGDIQYQYIWIQRHLERSSPTSELLSRIEKLALKAHDDDKTIQSLWRWALQKTSWESVPEEARKFLSRYPNDETIKQMLAESITRQQALRKEALLPINIAKRAAYRALSQQQLHIVQRETQKILALNPSDADGWGLIGYVAQRQGHYWQASEAFEKAYLFGKDAHWKRLATSASISAHVQSAQQALQAQDSEQVRAIAQKIQEIDKNTPEAMTLLAQAFQLEGQYAQAQAAYLQTLQQHPKHLHALNELVRMLIAQQQWELAHQRIDAHIASLPIGERAATQDLRAELMQSHSDFLWEQGQRSAALRIQEQVLVLQPNNPWSRYRLARMHLSMDDAEGAQLLMQEGVNLYGANPEMRYASALIAASNSQWELAVQDLESIPVLQRSDAAQQLFYESQLRIQIATAQNTNDPQIQKAAIAQGMHISELVENIDTQVELAGIWASTGYYQQACHIWERIAQQYTLTPHMQLMYAQALDAYMPQSTVLSELIEQLMHQQHQMSENEQSRLLTLLTDRTQRRIVQHTEQGQLRLARSVARQALLPQLHDQSTQIARGRLLAAAQDWDGALEAFETVLKPASDDFNLLLDTANAYLQVGKRQDALHLAHKAHAMAANQPPWQQLTLVRLWQRLEMQDKAQEILAQVEVHPQSDRNEVLLHRARIAVDQGLYLQALEDLHRVTQSAQLQKETPAKQARVMQEYHSIESRKQSWIEVGVKRLSKSGDPGISAMNGWEFSHKAWFADQQLQGHYFFQVDRLKLDAGPLAVQPDGSFTGMNEYGQIAAYLAQGYGGAHFKEMPSSRLAGVNAGIGFTGERYSWDIGLIGLHMPITNLAGGINFALLQTPYSSWRMSMGRRPVTGSVLSYTGARDPATSNIWGGVMNSFISLRVANRQNKWDRSANLSFGLLTGKNVATNTRTQLRLSNGTDIWSTTHQRLYMGTALQLQSHRKNLAEYSWGHGGYYSPKLAATLSFPLEWSGRANAWSWKLQTSLSLSKTAKSQSDLYPRSTTFKNSLTNAEQKNYYSSRASSGKGWAFQAALERQVNSHISVGGQISMDRSENYAPNQLQLYIRFFLSPRRHLGANQPHVLTPYSEY